MVKEWTIEGVLYIHTSVLCETEEEAQTSAKDALKELADIIRPYCDDVDVELGNVEEDAYD